MQVGMISQGSQFSYKPPPGTNRVIYKFKFYIGNKDSNDLLWYETKLCRGTEVTAGRNQVDVRTIMVILMISFMY